jgi:purine-binding chemotaxis protein CheW
MDNITDDNILDITDFEIVRTDGEKFVTFFLDEDTFAVSSKYVAEVDRLLSVTPLPNLADWVSGLANLRGEIVSVIDLRLFWNRNTNAPKKSKTIILRSRKESILLAFIVDRIGEISIVEKAEREIFSDTDIHSPLPHVYGQALVKGQNLHLLDVEKLLSSPKLQEIYS